MQNNIPLPSFNSILKKQTIVQNYNQQEQSIDMTLPPPPPPPPLQLVSYYNAQVPPLDIPIPNPKKRESVIKFIESKPTASQQYQQQQYYQLLQQIQWTSKPIIPTSTTTTTTTTPPIIQQNHPTTVIVKKDEIKKTPDDYYNNDIASSISFYKLTPKSLLMSSSFDDVAELSGVYNNNNKKDSHLSDLVGIQIRSCNEDKILLHLPALQNKIKELVKKHNLEEASNDVATIISHATEEHLKNIIEKLTIIAKNRLDVTDTIDTIEEEKNSNLQKRVKIREETEKMLETRDTNLAEESVSDQLSTKRIKRIYKSDLLFILEQDRYTRKSTMLYKAYLKKKTTMRIWCDYTNRQRKDKDVTETTTTKMDNNKTVAVGHTIIYLDCTKKYIQSPVYTRPFFGNKVFYLGAKRVTKGVTKRCPKLKVSFAPMKKVYFYDANEPVKIPETLKNNPPDAISPAKQ